MLRAQAAPQVIIALALLLTGTSLTLGFSVDELYQKVALNPRAPVQGLSGAPWDLFTFAPAGQTQTLMEQGVFPWYTDPDFAISFFRPLSSLSLWIDHTLWPSNTALMHLHSMAWYALLLATIWLVYRALLPGRELASLALLLYAVDDARALMVGWISLRNALVALVPAFLALSMHHRARSQQQRAAGLLAPALFGLGLLGGEVAVALLGYLVAYALFMERGTLLERARSLLPYAAVLLVYRVIYVKLGYGALHSDMYMDPARAPIGFMKELVTRLPVLVFAQFSLPPSELWEAYPLVAPWLQPLVLALVLLGLCLLAWLLWPLLSRSRELRFWALGMVLSTVPVCGTFPADRLLVASSLGGAALLSSLLHALLLTPPAPEARAPRLKRALAQLLVAMNLVFAPAFLTVRARDIELTRNLLEFADRSIPRGPEIQRDTLIMVNPPLSALALYFPIYRAAAGTPLPGHFRALATSETDLTIERVDDRSLKLRPEGGFLANLAQRVFRSADRKLPLGSRVRLSDMEFEVTQLTVDERPAEVLVRFDRSLEDPSLRWVRWGEYDYVPFTLPAPGASVRLPRVDALKLIFDVPRVE
ncbi:MAG TPA: hypothetical protein VFZ61_00690 [Polyangiales bacterium]